MTTTYTDTQIEVVAAKLADGISIEHGRPSPLKMGADMLRSLLSERQAAMQGQGGAGVPARFLIEKDAWEAAQFAFGGPGTGEGEEFMDCIAWVGDIENDDGSKTHGLHIQCTECPEEGSITLAEFDAVKPPQPVRSVSDEDVDGALDAYEDSAGPTCISPLRVPMRAALEHFAAIAQEKQS